jgi:hypothetical protein
MKNILIIIVFILIGITGFSQTPLPANDTLTTKKVNEVSTTPVTLPNDRTVIIHQANQDTPTYPTPLTGPIIDPKKSPSTTNPF